MLLPEGDPDLDHGAGEQRDEDLRDRQLEVEGDLPEDLERDDHRGQVQPRVAQLGQQDRVGPASNDERPPAPRGFGVSAHRGVNGRRFTDESVCARMEE